MRTQFSLPVRAHYSISTSLWYCVNAGHGFEAGPFLTEEEAKSFADGFNAEHQHYTRSASDWDLGQLRLTEEEIGDPDYGPAEWWPSWVDEVRVGDGAALCAAELFPGTWPLTSNEDIAKLRRAERRAR